MSVRTPVLVSEVVDLIRAALMADAELQGAPLNGNIYPDIEPGDVYPVLIVAGVTGENTRTLNSRHVWRDCTIQLTARDKGGTDKSQLVLIMRRVAIVLEGKRIQNDGIYVGALGEARERPRGPDLRGDDLYPQIVVEYDTKAYRIGA
jgi:hypothetical protein